MSWLRLLRASRGKALVAAGASWALASAVVAACTGQVVDAQGGAGAAVGAGGGLGCDALVADETTTPVEVRLVNQTAADLYFDNPVFACGYEPYFRLYDPQNQELPHLDASPCSARCAELTCTCTMTYTCGPFSVTRVAPGGVLSTTWNGAYLKPRTVPSSCVDCSLYGDSATCSAWTDPGSLSLTLRSNARTDVSCIDASCDCTPNANGTCVPSGQAQASGGTVVATATIAPGQDSIDLVFQ